MLYLVGLGLKPAHITEEALRVAKSTDVRIVDGYTTKVPDHFYTELEKRIGTFVRAKREDLEDRAREIIRLSAKKNVALCVWGDPLAATTHIMIRNMADEEGVEWKYVPGISIVSVVPSLIGLQHYRFGRVVTIPKMWKDAPSFFEKILRNMKDNMHTLCLIDIDMSVKEALKALTFWARTKNAKIGDVCVVSHATWGDQQIVAGTPEQIPDLPPPACIVVPSRMHPEEESAWTRWKV